VLGVRHLGDLIEGAKVRIIWRFGNKKGNKQWFDNREGVQKVLFMWAFAAHTQLSLAFTLKAIDYQYNKLCQSFRLWQSLWCKKQFWDFLDSLFV